MGETALKKTQFNEDVAKARHQYRNDQDALMIAMRGGQRVETQLAEQTRFQQALAIVFIRNVFQMPVMQAVANALANMPGALSKMAQNAASQILSFFFGHKKENDKAEEKHQRERTDASETDLFGKTMFNQNNVEGTQNKFLGG